MWRLCVERLLLVAKRQKAYLAAQYSLANSWLVICRLRATTALNRRSSRVLRFAGFQGYH